MISKKYILLLFVFSFMGLIHVEAQPSHSKKEYVNFVKNFYRHLTEDDTVTVSEFTELFSHWSIEYEGTLFGLICETNPNHPICNERGLRSLASGWSDQESIFFSHIKEYKTNFNPDHNDDIYEYISREAKISDDNDVSYISLDLTFSNGKTIYFILNRYPDEPIHIINIYLEDGIEIFRIYDSYLAKSKQNWETSSRFLERYGHINDPDGYTNVRAGKGIDYPIIGKIKKREIFIYTPNYYENWWKVKIGPNHKEGYVHKSRIIPRVYF